MYLGMLLLSAALLSLVPGGTANLQYALTFPASFISGDTARVCMNIVNSEEVLDLTVVLEKDGKNTSIFAEDVMPPSYFQCNEFKVPEAKSAMPVAITMSALGAHTKILERKTVVIDTRSNNCVFQMDKPIYKAGQKVMCRVICLDYKLKSVHEKFKSAYLQDPSRTKIAQHLHPETVRGVVDLVFQLIDDAQPGSYMISLERESGSPLNQWFTVQDYVPPRFSVDVVCPNSLSATDEYLKFNASAMYMYGEPLTGSITVRYCKEPQYYGRRRNCYVDKESTCANMTGELGPDGSYSGVIDMYSRFMRSSGAKVSLRLDFTVTEVGTGVQTTESRYTWITTQPASISFDYDSMNQYYKRQMDYPIVALLKDENNQPIPDQVVDIDVDGKPNVEVTTDSEGRATYNLDTSDMINENFTVRVSYQNPDQCYYSEWQNDRDYPSSEYTVYRFYSESGSFVQLSRPRGELTCGQTHKAEVRYTISKEGAGDGVNIVIFYYLVLTRSKIVANGQAKVDLSSSRNGSFFFDLPVSADMAPSSDLVVYSILQQELIADTVNLNIEKCFKNKVSLTFSAEKGMPGSEVEAHVSADPESICGLGMVDSSLLLLNPYGQLTADTVYSTLSWWNSGYNVKNFDVEEPAPPCEDPNKLAFFNGNYYLPVSSKSEGDVYEKMKSVGVVIGTGARLRKPVVCGNEPQVPVIRHSGKPIALAMDVSARFSSSKMNAEDAAPGGSSGGSVETVRENFAETFLWLMLPLDAEGHATLTQKVPDTITKYQGSAFCLSDEKGFGMTRYQANYTTYLPFFIELTMPNSFVRGETMELKGVVHNYMDTSCVKVKVALQPSTSYTAVQTDGQQDSSVLPNGKATYAWEINSNVIGKINFTVTAQTTHIGASCDGPNDSSQPSRKDTVIRSIDVEPEGIRRERTLSTLISVQNSNAEIPVNITPPPHVVSDSSSAYVTAVGDIVTLPLRSLKDLVQKPYGCGEQNLARLATIPCVVEYLNVTNQLTDSLLQEAKSYMTEGYIRQLPFVSGGAYRTFRNSREPANSWLTAGTFKTLEQIKKYVFVDENRQQQTLIWLENAQRLDNGCFKASGRPYIMQSGPDTDYDLHFTIYLASALLESEYSLGKTLLNKALECLKNASKTEQSLTNEVLMLYVFTLAGLSEYREPLCEKLMKKAIVEGGTIHWEPKHMPKRPGVPFFLPPHSSADVQVTAYMLLSMMAGPDKSPAAMTTMAQTCVWLTRQQNSNGGFYSTQDTVVALQAITGFAKMIYTPDSHHTVTVRKDSRDVTSFELNNDNRLVVQRHQLPDASGHYSVVINGLGWCLIQTTVSYYVPVPKENSAFSLSLVAHSDNCLNGVAYSFDLDVNLRYVGERTSTNMVLVKIKMFSGYSADYGSLRELENGDIISKAEVGPRGDVILYIDSMSHNDDIKVSFKVFMGQRVLNVKSSSGSVLDYYEEEENGYASYDHPCAAHKA